MYPISKNYISRQVYLQKERVNIIIYYYYCYYIYYYHWHGKIVKKTVGILASILKKKQITAQHTPNWWKKKTVLPKHICLFICLPSGG